MADVRAGEGEASAAKHSGNLTALPIGHSLGKYELLEILGQGSFGITYLAQDSLLGRRVAIKEYLPTSLAVRQGGTRVLPRATEVASDFIWGRERFLDEARTLVKLESVPAIVRVIDYLEANGTAYMVMALLTGELLEARLRRDKTLPQPEIDRLVYPLLDGLEQVHAAGFLHRDIKPGNIILDPRGGATLIDFGAARAAMADRTKAMTAIYTPAYAAVEQFTSAKQGPWTDIYALSATLYHCVAGTPPPGALDRMLEDTLVPAATAARGKYGRGLLTAIDVGLRVRMQDRPPTIEAWRSVFMTGAVPVHGSNTRDMGVDQAHATRGVADDGAAVVASAGTPRRQPPGLAGVQSAPGPRAEPAVVVAQRPKWAWLAAAAAAVVVVLGAGGGYLTLGPASAPGPTTPTVAADQLRRDAELDAKRQAEEETRRKATEEAERRRQADLEAQRKADEERRRQAEARRQEEDVRRRAAEEAESRRQAELEVQRKAEAERQRQAEPRRQEEDVRRKAAEEAERRRQAELEAQRKAEDERLRQAEAEARRAAEEGRRIAEEKAKAEAARREDEARRQAEAEKARQEAARHKAEDDARRQAEEERQRAAAAEARRKEEEVQRAEEAQRAKAEAERKKAEEDRARAETEAKRTAETTEAGLRLGETERKRVQAGLTARGFDAGTPDGSFGPRTRQMISAYQRSRGETVTGYLTQVQYTALVREGEKALTKLEEERVAAEAKRKEEEERKNNSQSSTPAAAGVDGAWSSTLACTARNPRSMRLQLDNGRGAYNQFGVNAKVRVDGNVIVVDVIDSQGGRELIGTLRGAIAGSSGSASGTLNTSGGGGPGPMTCVLTIARGDVAPPPAASLAAQPAVAPQPTAAATQQPADSADGSWSGSITCVNWKIPISKFAVVNGRGNYKDSTVTMALTIDGTAVSANMSLDLSLYMNLHGGMRPSEGKITGQRTGASLTARGMIGGGAAAQYSGNMDCLMSLTRQ